MTKGLFQEVEKRTIWGHPQYYQPFSQAQSRELREHYRSELDIPLTATSCGVRTKDGTLIAMGYDRVVVGDYGAFIEISKKDIVGGNIRDKWSRNTSKPVKYFWMVAKDSAQTKVYDQQKTVSYADYKPGFYYVDPKDVVIESSLS